MTMTEWEDFIHSSAAVGTQCRIRVSAAERATWPMLKSFEKALQKLEPGSNVVQLFDASVPDGAVATVLEASYCGWLKIEVADYGVLMAPGLYLKPMEAL